MPNMSLKKFEMPMLDASSRIKTFEEVSLGYSKDIAMAEAERCLNCKNAPCIKGCPVGINIPGFIQKIKEEAFEDAYHIIEENSFLPAICGRVCPQEKQCEGKCLRGIKGEPVGIGRLERFVADYHNNLPRNTSHIQSKNHHKIAVIGSGPAGLACAGELAQRGYDVTIFEALHTPGGVLVYGIPEFRLPKKIVEQEIANLLNKGVKIKTNMVIGKVLSIDELMDEYHYEAVFIGSGAGLPKFMGIPGENLKGVFSANEVLTRINLMKAYLEFSQTPINIGENVAVVGGGNVAMDAARSAKRLGAKNVYIIYRRGMEELPARKEEVEHALEEGIIFKVLTNPIELLKDDAGAVNKMKCVEMELGLVDATGRRKPVVKENSTFEMNIDTVIMALGTSPNPLIKNTTEGLETESWGVIKTDSDGLTSRKGIFAGGDAVTGAATVILAMGSGKKAAVAIDKYIKTKNEQ